MFKRIAACAALAAGAVILTACGMDGPAAGTRQGTAATGVTQNVTAGESVDCGEVQVNGATHTLVAEATAGGIVGCTEAFNVLDDYLTRGTSIEDTTLSNGWSCTTDDGETASIGCVTGRTGVDDFAFHTEPKSTPGDLQPVDCGEVDVNGTKHMLTAEPTATGIVGCTEAFTVLDEYLRHGTSIEDTKLSNGWSCSTDDGETASIGCVKGNRVGDEYEFAFSTKPM